ncbi:MAG: hypothetical protein ACRDN0_00550 [Trebonia sp.]
MRTTRLLATTAALTAGMSVLLTGCGASQTGSSQAASSSPGWHTSEVENQADYGAEVDLVNPANGAIYDELENTGPGTTVPMSIDLGSGKYAFLCEVQDYSPFAGPTVTVSGHAKGTSSPQWTGFYRLEYGLWHGQSAAELTPVANTTTAAARRSLRRWPTSAPRATCSPCCTRCSSPAIPDFLRCTARLTSCRHCLRRNISRTVPGFLSLASRRMPGSRSTRVRSRWCRTWPHRVDSRAKEYPP